jgi:hypothetical protein
LVDFRVTWLFHKFIQLTLNHPTHSFQFCIKVR